MKKLLFTLTLLITLSSFGQSKNEVQILDEKVVFIKKNNRHLINENTKLLILENKDTLILTKRYIPKFVFPDLPTKRETRNFKSKYSYLAFGSYSSNYNKKNLSLRQWNVPIKVFVDNSFSRENRNDIEKIIVYFSKLEIPNLNIKLVKNKRISNYYITTSNEKFETLDAKKLDQYSDEQIKNRYKDNANYFLTSDNNNKNYSCVLKVNINTFEEEENIQIKVKKLFFSSLGRFYFFHYNPKESLLSTKYKNSDTLSTYDISILKTHYNYIYPYKVDFNLFKIIEEK